MDLSSGYTRPLTISLDAIDPGRRVVAPRSLTIPPLPVREKNGKTTPSPKANPNKERTKRAGQAKGSTKKLHPFDVSTLQPLPIRLAPTSPQMAEEREIELVCRATRLIPVKFKGAAAAAKALGVARTLVGISCRNYGTNKGEVYQWKSFVLRFAKKRSPSSKSVYLYGTQTQDLFHTQETHQERLHRWYKDSVGSTQATGDIHSTAAKQSKRSASEMRPGAQNTGENHSTPAEQSKRPACEVRPGLDQQDPKKTDDIATAPPPAKVARKDPPQASTPPPPSPLAATAQQQLQQRLILDGATVSDPIPVPTEGSSAENQKAFNTALGQCIVCQTENAQIVFQPCYHCVICANCSTSCPIFCPTCRTKISNRVRPTRSVQLFQPRIYSANAFM
jgi:hypothetical protein